MLDFDEKKFLSDFNKENVISRNYIKSYFNNCSFSDNLILKIELVNDNFKKII